MDTKTAHELLLNNKGAIGHCYRVQLDRLRAVRALAEADDLEGIKQLLKTGVNDVRRNNSGGSP